MNVSSMKNVTIREVVPEDLGALVDIARQTFIDTYASLNSEENMRSYLKKYFSKEQLSADLTCENTIFYFAFIDDQVVGYLKLNTGDAQTELQRENSLEIERIYVLKALQGNRVGQRFCAHAAEVAKERKADFVWLGVWEQNLKAIEFYEKNGFVTFNQHVFVLGDEEQTDLMMKLVLE